MLSPRALFRGNPARVKFAAENSITELSIFHNQAWEIYQHFDIGI